MRRSYRPVHLRETIADENYRLNEEAKKLAEVNKNKKVIKYDLKR